MKTIDILQKIDDLEENKCNNCPLKNKLNNHYCLNQCVTGAKIKILGEWLQESR